MACFLVQVTWGATNIFKGKLTDILCFDYQNNYSVSSEYKKYR